MPIPGPSAAVLDAADPLRHFRGRFALPARDLVYLDGNSLGPPPAASLERMLQVCQDEWAGLLVEGWNAGWIDLAARTGDLLAQLLGAQPGEVIACDSTSVNLFKLAVAVLRAAPEPRRVVTDDLQFPTDLYILRSALEASGGGEMEVVASEDGVHGNIAALRAVLERPASLVCLSHVTFKSAYLYDMAAVNAAARAAGALVLWDLGHSAGAVPVDLRAAGADLAVGCTYKYLNAGPGAPAYLYVRRELQERLANPIAGWMGHARPFDFSLDYEPAPDIRRFLAGTPPILALAMVAPGVEMVLEAGTGALREKSVALTGRIIDAWESLLQPLGFGLGSPREDALRGSHVSLRHPAGQAISRTLRRRFRVVPDFRPPDNIRLGVSPLYMSFTDVDRAVAALARAAGAGEQGCEEAGEVP